VSTSLTPRSAWAKTCA